MDKPSGLDVARALADPTRLNLLKALLERPHYAEELARRLGLAASTITFHLKKLEAAGLIERRREQYYAVFVARRAALERPLLDLVEGAGGDAGKEEERLAAHRLRVLGTFAPGGRVERLPVQRKKRLIVLMEFAALLEPGRVYPERELNEVFSRHHADYCTVRRELIGERVLARESRLYRLIGPEPLPPSLLLSADLPPAPEEDPLRRARARAETSPGGIYGIHNLLGGKIFVGRGSGVRGRLAGLRAQLEWKSHRCEALQRDWNDLGAEAFSFDVLEELEPTGDATLDRRRLAELERAWLERLEPWGERGYNRPPASPRP